LIENRKFENVIFLYCLHVLRPDPEGFVCINCYTYNGACCESNALLWLRNMGQRPERTL